MGDTWGGPDVTALFHTTLELPETHTGDRTYSNLLDGGEAQLSVNDAPYQGLDWYRSLARLVGFRAGDRLELDIEAFVVNYPHDNK